MDIEVTRINLELVADHIAQTKRLIALTDINCLMTAAEPFGCVLADAAHRGGAPFRQVLSTRGLSCAAASAAH